MTILHDLMQSNDIFLVENSPSKLERIKNSWQQRAHLEIFFPTSMETAQLSVRKNRLKITFIILAL